MEMAVIYGAITLHGDYVRSTEFIKSLVTDLMFPPINTSDFGLGDYDNYHYEGKLMYDYSWDNMIISYAHTTGAAVIEQPCFKVFILKMEHILRNIDFVKAIVHIQSAESLEDANLFWEKKEHRYFNTQEELKDQYLIETDEWNFGYGRRSLIGYLDEPADRIWHSFKEDQYPPRFPEEFTRLFFERINVLTQDYSTKKIPRAALEQDSLLSKYELRMIISYLSFKKLLAIDIEEDLEVVQVLRPDLLKIDCLYR